MTASYKRTTALALSGLLALALAGCASVQQTAPQSPTALPAQGSGKGTSRAIAVTTTGSPAVKRARATTTSAFAVPAGYGRPVDLTGDTASGGVWFLAESAADVSVFHWDATAQSMRQYSLGDPSANGLQFGAQSALVLAPDGSVWAGANSTLVHLDPATGKVNSIKIVSPPDNSSAEGLRPPEVRGYHAVESLAINSSGTIAIAMSAASAIEEYTPSTGAFTQVALSGNVEPLAVSFSSTGLLGVAVADWSDRGDTNVVELVGATGVSTIPADSLDITAFKSGFVSGGTQSQTDVISAPTGSSATNDVVGLGAADAAQVGIPAQVTPGGSIVLAARSGFDVLAPDGSAVATLQLPTFDCGSMSIVRSGTQAPPPTSSTCLQAPRAFGVDGSGDIWFTTNASSQVFEISSTSVPAP